MQPSDQPTRDLFQKTSGGEPRSGGYWLLWNKCAENNQSAVAESNGGRSAGWIVMEDLLEEPGILLGTLQVESCDQGVRLLRIESLDGKDRKGDIGYELAAQLLAAQLNMAAGSASCTAAEQAVEAGQLLLLAMEFNGTGDYIPAVRENSDRETAQALIPQLERYNTGLYCR